jgi:CSLREA domain-containing protein
MSITLLAHLRRSARLALLGILIITMTLPLATPAFAANLTVNSIADTASAADGQCTLREAISNANTDSDTTGGDCLAGGGTDTISFAIPGGGLHTISLASGLPTITAPLTINGVSQSGANCAAWPPTLLIELRGPGGGTGLDISTNGVTVRGLVINQFQTGIEIAFATGSAIECNFIGTDPGGTLPRPNISYGIQIQGSASGNTIGGPLVTQRNLIADRTR